MAAITFKGNSVKTLGTLPAAGTAAPDFLLTSGELKDLSLKDFAGKTLVLNIVPSLDTGICALSAKRFNQEAAALKDTVIANVSMDLPFAQGRFCSSEGLENIINLSGFRSQSFGSDYQVTMTDGPLAGLYSRAVVVIGADGQVVYSQQVPEIVQEPDYDAVLAAL